MISGAVVWSLADFPSSFGGGVEAHGHLNLEARWGERYLDCTYTIFFILIYILVFFCVFFFIAQILFHIFKSIFCWICHIFWYISMHIIYI